MSNDDNNLPPQDDDHLYDYDRPESDEPTEPQGEVDAPAGTEDAERDDSAAAEAFYPDQPKVNFKEDLQVTSELKDPKSVQEGLALIRESQKTLRLLFEVNSALIGKMEQEEQETIDGLIKRRKAISDDVGNLWIRNTSEAVNHSMVDDFGLKASAREGSEWVQRFDHEGVDVRSGQPRIKSPNPNDRMAMRNYLAKRAGTGTVFDVMLPHSGIWLRLHSPSLAGLTTLVHQAEQLKLNLGSVTKGLVFSNVMQVVTSVVVDFALNHVEAANIHYNTPSDLKENIKQPDIPILLWGLAVTMFPRGVQYSHSCVADLDKCQHVTKENLNINRLFWVDHLSLSKQQKLHLSKRFAKASEEDLKLYHDSNIRGGKRVVWFGDQGLELKIPSVLEYEEAGQSWINNIIEMTQGAFNEPPHGTNRSMYITRLSNKTTARNYTHWINAVYERDEEGQEQLLTDNLEVIHDVLDVVFSDDAYQEEFFDKVSEYIDDTLLAMVAVPSFDCEACDTPVAKKFHERFPHLVPIDVLTTFFTLVNLKAR